MATFAELLTRLDIKARDGGDITFTDPEKTEALTTAFNDGYVVNVVRDTSLTTTSATDYAVPATITTILKAGIQNSTYGRPTDIEGWNVYGSRIYLDNCPPSGKAIVLVGTYKVAISDAITDVARQEYVLVLAKLELVRYLKESLANTFLTNDMTMGDLSQKEQALLRDAREMREGFINSQVIEL